MSSRASFIELSSIRLKDGQYFAPAMKSPGGDFANAQTNEIDEITEKTFGRIAHGTRSSLYLQTSAGLPPPCGVVRVIVTSPISSR